MCSLAVFTQNGVAVELSAPPLLVTVKLYVDESVKNPAPALVFNNKLVCVPVMAALGEPFTLAACVAVNGAVAGVNAPVYTATPLTTRKFEIYPGTPNPPRAWPEAIVNGAEVLYTVPDTLTDPPDSPFIQMVQVLPDLVTAR